MEQIEFTIKGKVQGVGFRFFAQHKANQLGIKGWVKNSSKGVVVMAQGDEKDLDTFMDYLWQGPPLARVDDILTVRINELDNLDRFWVKY
jgi:acylphosphatase